MNKIKISAVLVVKNEEKNIKRCLSSVKDLADEIIVVDEQSTDKTVEIAQEFTDKIFNHKSSGFVEPARNFSIEKASGDWILILDADEEIEKGLFAKLKNISEKGESDYVLIPRKNLSFNAWIKNTGWWPDYQIRFFRKGKVIWQEKIHSKPEVSGKQKTLEPTEENALVHHNYDSVSQFLSKLDMYTTVEVSQVSDRTFILSNLIKNPVNEFISRYFSHKGYRDGIHGFVLSVLMAFYIFVVEIKIWEKSGFNDKDQNEALSVVKSEARSVNKLLRYWLITTSITESKNPLQKIFLKILRKK